MRAWLIILLTALTACTVPQKGSNSPEIRTELDELAAQNIPVSEKYLQLGKVVAVLLDESAAITQDAASGNHIIEFVSDNESALNRLYVQIDNWEKYLTEEDRMFFVMELLAQPWSTRLQGLHNGLKKRFADQPKAAASLEKVMDVLAFKR